MIYDFDFEKALKEVQIIINNILDRILSCDNRHLMDAMRYGVLGGGQRFRPFLLYQASNLFNICEKSKETVAAALEMVHCFSLIHDDLPAMDNDDFRRGLPSMHIAFDEATAILAGDALLVYGFNLLADDACHKSLAVRLRLIKDLSQAIGCNGMLSGQMMDIDCRNNLALDSDAMMELQYLKTARLIEFSCCAGGILGGASQEILDQLKRYARNIGIAFQITDDLDDHLLDKRTKKEYDTKDKKTQSTNFVTILKSKETARSQVNYLIDQAIYSLHSLGSQADGLRAFANFLRTKVS